MEYGRVEQIVREAAQLASKKLAEKGLPPLPHTTPHTLRRTYISIALVAYEWDVKYVMDQVGHADSKMTLDVYAQMQQRAKRDNGCLGEWVEPDDASRDIDQPARRQWGRREARRWSPR